MNYDQHIFILYTALGALALAVMAGMAGFFVLVVGLDKRLKALSPDGGA